MTSTALVCIAPHHTRAAEKLIDGVSETINDAQAFEKLTVGRDQSNSELTVDTGGNVSVVNNNNGEVFIGINGGSEGTLTISGGGVLTAEKEVRAASVVGSKGTITVSGAGSTLKAGGPARIGFNGDGVLNVLDGGEFSAETFSSALSSAGSTANITVSGAGSKLTTTEFMRMARVGTGTLTINNGGVVEAGSYLELGKYSGSDATLIIGAASGQAATAAGSIQGKDGAAATIEFGAGAGKIVFNHTDTDLDFNANVTGTGNIEAFSGTTILSGTNDIGGGAINVEGGQLKITGTTKADKATIGENTGSAGKVTISGSGSKLSITGASETLKVGSSGSGTLRISDGGEVAIADSLAVGRNASGSGIVTISGSGSKLTSTDDFFIGDRGTGTLTITGGGEAAASIDVVIGDEVSGSGTVTVSGSGSKLTAGEIVTVGNEGAATLTVSDGGAVDAGTFVIIGNSSEGTATVTGSGSKLTAAENLIVGNLDDGTLTILAGGAAEAVNNVNIALNFGSTSTATVSGAGSKLAAGSSFNVGNGGAGTLNVTNGGYVDTGSVLTVGTDSTANGTVTISGAGSVVKNGFATYVGKDGQGTLTISNGGDLEGADVIFFGFAAGSEGTGTVNGSGSKLSSQAVLIGRQGNGTLTVSNGGVAEVTTGVTIARDAGTSGTLNIGAASGDAAVAAGTVRGTNGAAANISFGSGTGSLVFNHSETDYDFNAAVSGNGTLSQEAGRTTLTGDFSGFTGTGAVSGGTLAVNTNFGHPVNVLSGGTLTGTGSVGALDFATGSAYEFDFNGNGGLTSTGAITIAAGSHLAVEFGNSANVSIWQPTTVLTGTSVTGTFDTTNTNDYLFLDIGVSYTATEVVVDVDRNGVTFSSFASSPNHSAVAAAVNGLANGNAVYDAFSTLKTAADARNAFDQLSGEAHASTASGLVMGSNTLRSVIDSHMRSPSGQTQAGAVEDMFLAYFPKASTPEGGDLPDWAGILDNDISATPVLDAWGKVYGDFGKVNGNANAAEQTSAGGGALVGLETDNFYGFQAGMLLGYGRSGSQVAGRSSQADINSFTAGAYGSRNFGALRAQVGTTFSYHAIDAERQVAFGAFSDTLTANYGAQTIQGFGELSYAVDLPLATLAPFAGLAIVQSNTDGFTETGGAAALKIDGTTQTSGVSTVGVRINGQVGATGMASKLAYNGTLGWRHQFGADAPSVTSSFASGGPGFTVAGVPIDQDTLVIEAGLTYSASSTTDLAVAYGGEFGTSTQHHNVNARLSNKF